MKVIGVVGTCVGGLTAFLRHFASTSFQPEIKRLPELMVHQFPLDAYLDNLDKCAATLLASIEKLASWGADFALIPNNTMHLSIQEVEHHSPLPVINLLDVVAMYCKQQNLSHVLLLGTCALLDSEVYQQALISLGIQCSVMTDDAKILLDDELMRLTVSEPLRNSFSKNIETLVQEAASKYDGVILACSELVQSFHQKLAVPTIDPMQLLAYAAINRANESLST